MESGSTYFLETYVQLVYCTECTILIVLGTLYQYIELLMLTTLNWVNVSVVFICSKKSIVFNANFVLKNMLTFAGEKLLVPLIPKYCFKKSSVEQHFFLSETISCPMAILYDLCFIKTSWYAFWKMLSLFRKFTIKKIVRIKSSFFVNSQQIE